jgi:hypothetical protein
MNSHVFFFAVSIRHSPISHLPSIASFHFSSTVRITLTNLISRLFRVRVHCEPIKHGRSIGQCKTFFHPGDSHSSCFVHPFLIFSARVFDQDLTKHAMPKFDNFRCNLKNFDRPVSLRSTTIVHERTKFVDLDISTSDQWTPKVLLPFDHAKGLHGWFSRPINFDSKFDHNGGFGENSKGN